LPITNPSTAPPKTPAHSPRVLPPRIPAPAPRVDPVPFLRVPEVPTQPPVRPPPLHLNPVSSRTRAQNIPTAPGLGEAVALSTHSRTLAAAKDAKAHVNLVMLANVAQATRSNSLIIDHS
jgi:hypothetical protein